MKTLFLTYYLALSFNLFQPKPAVFNEFLKYVSTRGHLTEKITSNCQWQYALVKINCNKRNKVISHQFLNTVNEDVKKYYHFLDGYEFEKNIPINGHSVIFCMTFENHNTDCILKNRSIPTDILKEVYGELGKQVRIDNKTIILYDIISATYNEDPIK